MSYQVKTKVTANVEAVESSGMFGISDSGRLFWVDKSNRCICCNTENDEGKVTVKISFDQLHKLIDKV